MTKVVSTRFWSGGWYFSVWDCNEERYLLQGEDKLSPSDDLIVDIALANARAERKKLEELLLEGATYEEIAETYEDVAMTEKEVISRLKSLDLIE